MEQSAKIWTLPNDRLRQFTSRAIEDWYYDYRKAGIDALINPPRADTGTHRVMNEKLCMRIDQILRDYPPLKSSNVIRLLDKDQLRFDGRPSAPTY